MNQDLLNIWLFGGVIVGLGLYQLSQLRMKKNLTEQLGGRLARRGNAAIAQSNGREIQIEYEPFTTHRVLPDAVNLRCVIEQKLKIFVVGADNDRYAPWATRYFDDFLTGLDQRTITLGLDRFEIYSEAPEHSARLESLLQNGSLHRLFLENPYGRGCLFSVGPGNSAAFLGLPPSLTEDSEEIRPVVDAFSTVINDLSL